MMVYTTAGSLIGELVPEPDKLAGSALLDALLALGPPSHEIHCACHDELKRLRAKLPPPVVGRCKQCGERFEGRRRGAFYCSKRCCSAAYEARRRRRR